VSAVSQEWKDEKHSIITEGQSYSSLDEEGNTFQINSLNHIFTRMLYKPELEGLESG